jgi:dienelactone hydrolase
VLFAHPGGLDRYAFLEEAGLLAQGGAISLLVDAPHARRPGQPIYRFTQEDHTEFMQAVTELQRGIDLLQARPQVDPMHIGFVGFSYGAIVGALLAGVETRIRTYILWSCVARLDAFLRELGKSLPAAELAAYLGIMAPLDPVEHVGGAAPAALLFQFGRADKRVPEEHAQALFRAAGHPKQELWYDAGHALDGKARQDRYEWLHRQFGLDPPTPDRVKALGDFTLKKMARQGGSNAHHPSA